MLDNQLIEIFKIDKLCFIYCYLIDSKDYNNLSKSLGIEIVYGDKKKMKFDYKSEYFYQYFNKIKEVYNREKSKNNITFLNDFSKEVIENYNIAEISTIENYTDKNIYPMNTNKFQVSIFMSYIFAALESVLRMVHDIKKTKIKSITGYRNKYVATYEVDYEQHIVSLYCNKKGNNCITFEIGCLDNIGIRVNGNIKINDEYVITNWSAQDGIVSGQIYYDINNGFTEEELRYNSAIIYYDRCDSTPSKDEIDGIISVLRPIIDIDYDNCVKTTHNSYIFKHEKEDGKSRNYYYYHVVISSDIICVNYTEKNGYIDDDGGIFIPTLNGQKDFLIINMNDTKLIQEHNLNNNKYRYQILKDNNLSDIDISNYDSVDEIKNRGDNNGIIRRF